MDNRTKSYEYPAISANLFGGLESTLEGELHDNKCPYRQLWQAIILQAILDVRSKKKTRLAQFNKFKAERWLLHGGKSFERACHFAGFDPACTRQKLLQAKERAYLTLSEVRKNAKID